MSGLPDHLSMQETAFFFDFDGTLVELASTPDGVVVEPRVIDVLSALHRLTHGALAIVSGRALSSIDPMLAPLLLPAAGLHGAERRDANGTVTRLGFDDARLLTIEQQLEQTVRENPGTLLEIKSAALALHYRNAPGAEAACRAATERQVALHPDAYVLQPGKMVFEIKPKNVDKGRAVAAFLEEAPFAGRRPVFAGDDLTDEKGFAVVNRYDGIAIKVGAGDTLAGQRVASVNACLDWLEALVSAAKA